MIGFNTTFFEKFLSQPYLSDTNKDRLRKGLAQFRPEKYNFESSPIAEKSYTHFYLRTRNDFLLQGDILLQMRHSIFNEDSTEYEKIYTEAIIISSTCDIEDETKSRDMPKQILFAPLVELESYLSEIAENENISIENIKLNIKNQQNSNIFYLPPNPQNGKEYVAILDRLFWFPTKELQNANEQLLQDKIASLDYFGYYLFLLKISYHLCRLPEDKHR